MITGLKDIKDCKDNKDEARLSLPSLLSFMSFTMIYPMPERFIPRHGGYKNLLSFQKAELVYDATVSFCDRYIDKRSRTHD